MPWNAAHQINADVVEALVRGGDGALGPLGVMRAPKRSQHVVVEALHADGQAVHAERPDVAHHGGREAFGVRFHGALDVGFKAHGQAERVQQHGQAA